MQIVVIPRIDLNSLIRFAFIIQDKRTRKCSIVREEDEEDSSHELTCEGNELKVAVTRRESISDGRLNRLVQEKCSNIIPCTAASNKCGVGGGDADDHDSVVMDTPTKMVVSVDAALAQKLKQLDKDTSGGGGGEDIMLHKPNATSNFTHMMDAADKSSEMHDTLRGLKELEIGKLKHLPGNAHKNPVLTHRRHSKLNKIRTPSCSSSEASDDDTKSRNKKKIHKLGGDTPTRFRMHRRDSHDDSSDSQDQGFPATGTHGGHELITSSNVSNKKEGQNHQVK